MKRIKLTESPYLEMAIMVSSTLLAYAGLAILSMVGEAPQNGGMPTQTIALILLAFFMLSCAIAAVSVIAGIGGGVIFTPIMLAFTGIDSIVVRGTGLIVAMFSGLISTGVFIKKGIGNYRLCALFTLAQGLGALTGAMAAIAVAKYLGESGEGFMRIFLGLILVAVAVYFFVGGQKLEWPAVTKVGRFTKWLKLETSYYEESEAAVRGYKVKRAGLGLTLLFLVGLIGGFFGMGGGWAITPTLNIAMGLPLKVAAANSGVILGVGSCVSIWPYIFAGGVIPMFVLPWLSGQVIGGFVGSYALAKIKVHMVRLILIGIMIYTSFGLITKGLSMLGVIRTLPAVVQLAVFTAVMLAVILITVKNARKKKETRNG